MVHSIPLSASPPSSSGATGSSAPAAAHGPVSRPSWHALVAAFAATGLFLTSHTLVGEVRRPALIALVHTLAIAILGKPLLPSLDSAVPALDTWSLALASASTMAASYWALYLVPAHVFVSLLLLEVPLVSFAMAIVGSSTHTEYAPGRAASALDGLTASSGAGVPTYLSFGLIAAGSLLIAANDLMTTPLAIPVCVLALASSTLAIVLLKSKPAFARLSGKHALALTAPRSAALLAGAVVLVEIPTLSQLNQPLALSSTSLSLSALSTVLAVIAAVCGASPVNRAYSRSTVLGLTEVTLTAMVSSMMAQPALTGSHAWAMFAGFLAALGGLFLYSSAAAKAQHYDRLDVPLMTDEDKPDFYSTRSASPTTSSVSKFSTITLAVLAALFGIGLLVGTGTVSEVIRQADEIAHPSPPPPPSQPEFKFPPLNLPHLKPKPRGKRLPKRPAGKKESVAEVMYKLFNADELGLDWEWDWRQDQPGAIVNGKKQRVVVMHADTRPLQDLEQVANDPFNFNHMTMGPLYVMWWAMRHGYDYRRVRLNQPGVKVGGWGKPKVIYDALHRYDWVVFVDSDAYPRRPDLSLEDLLDRWGFHANASLMLPLDPPEQPPENRNATNNGPAFNTGFWIARSTPTAKAMLRDLSSCPERANCQKWWSGWPAEQAAFSKLVVPNYVQGRDIISAPCGESNGWWAVQICPGALWTHTWTGKEWAPKNMIERFMIEQIKVWQRLMKASYHSTDECTFWKSGEDERCAFKEDLESIDGGRSTDLA